MLRTPYYLLEDDVEVARLIRANPWAAFVSSTSHGIEASHYATLLDEEAWAKGELAIVSHFGRGEIRLHELASVAEPVEAREMLVIIAGPHDYISPAWYDRGDTIPTWNHVTAHLYGVPELLSDEENWQNLNQLVQHFEGGDPGSRAEAQSLGDKEDVARGTVGIRLRVTRYEARAKLSQNKTAEIRTKITEELDLVNPALAAEMRHFAP